MFRLEMHWHFNYNQNAVHVHVCAWTRSTHSLCHNPVNHVANKREKATSFSIKRQLPALPRKDFPKSWLSTNADKMKTSRCVDMQFINTLKSMRYILLLLGYIARMRIRSLLSRYFFLYNFFSRVLLLILSGR